MQFLLSSFLSILVSSIKPLVHNFRVFLKTLETKIQLHIKCILLKDMPIKYKYDPYKYNKLIILGNFRIVVVLDNGFQKFQILCL